MSVSRKFSLELVISPILARLVATDHVGLFWRRPVAIAHKLILESTPISD